MGQQRRYVSLGSPKPPPAMSRHAHYEASLQRDIDLIGRKVTEMSGLCEGALRQCLQALQERNRQLAYGVILRDRRVDDLEKQVDRLCLEYLVRQQPVARHLRFAYATIKINAELERIGDYAESIARQVLKLSSMRLPPLSPKYEQIANLSIPMLHDAVKAFLTQDAELARKTMAVEEQVDALRNQINADLLALRKEDQLPLEAFTPMMTIARRFERVSDQANNICEEVLYLVTGEYAKHPGTEVTRILFVDDHNACRSQMAEAIASSLDQPGFMFASAGMEPKPLDPRTLDFLKTKGLDTSRRRGRRRRSPPRPRRSSDWTGRWKIPPPSRARRRSRSRPTRRLTSFCTNTSTTSPRRFSATKLTDTTKQHTP
jgi:phosphate transport system protein